MSQYYSNPKREGDAHALPDVEVFHISQRDIDRHKGDSVFSAPGWYFWYCFPGCMPDGEAEGPYDTEQDALDAMREDADNGGDDEN